MDKAIRWITFAVAGWTICSSPLMSDTLDPTYGVSVGTCLSNAFVGTPCNLVDDFFQPNGATVTFSNTWVLGNNTAYSVSDSASVLSPTKLTASSISALSGEITAAGYTFAMSASSQVPFTISESGMDGKAGTIDFQLTLDQSQTYQGVGNSSYLIGFDITGDGTSRPPDLNGQIWQTGESCGVEAPGSTCPSGQTLTTPIYSFTYGDPFYVTLILLARTDVFYGNSSMATASGTLTIAGFTVNPVPEPATMSLIFLAVFGVVVSCWRRTLKKTR